VSDHCLVSHRHRVAAKPFADRDKALWLTLVGEGFGYLVPNPRFKCVGGGGGNDESIHYLVAQQQFDGPLSRQQGVTMKDETE